MPKKDNQTKTVGLVMLIMFAGKLTGLYRDILFSAAYGTDTVYSKAFTFASNMPRYFLDFAFASAISASFIPVFNTYLEKRDKEQAFELANSFITLIVLLSGAFTVLGMLFSTPLVGLFAPGYLNETKVLASSLLKIMVITIVLSGAAFSLTGVLQSLGEFNIPAAMSVFSNCLIIFYYIFLLDKFGVFGLAVTFVLGWATQILVQVPPLVKRGYRYRFILNLKDGGLREIGALMLPVLIGSWVMPVNFIVNQRAASTLFDGEGAVIIDKANILYSVITGIFILSITNVIFPRMAKQQAANDLAGYGETIRSTISGMLFFLIPMTVGVYLLSEPIVRLCFERGEFTALSTAKTSVALGAYSLGMIGFGLQNVLSRGFYAAKDGKTPMITGIMAIALNAALSYALIKPLGIAAPALASSLSINAAGLVMYAVMARRTGGSKKMLFNILKMAASVCVMAAAVTATRKYFIAVPVTAGVATYMLTAFLLRADETKMVYSFLKGVRHE